MTRNPHRIPLILAACLAAAACSREAETPAPAEPVTPVEAAPREAAGAATAYQCEGGQTIRAAYGDGTVQLAWRGQTHVLRSAPAASGARYAGTGLEWWTASRDGIESATLAELRADGDPDRVVVARCSRPASAVPATGTGPAADAGGGAVIPPGQTVAPCRSRQLRPTEAGGDAGMGHRVAIIALENAGTGPCLLSGYPGVTLEDGDGEPLTTVKAEQRPGSFLRPGQAPEPVTLPARGRAYFDLAWTVIPHEGEGETTCPTATRVLITAPGDTAAAPLRKTFTPCGGKVEVSPLRAVGQPTP